jgi:hypothetical protein
MTPPTGANDQEGPPPLTFLGGLLVWLKRLTEVNEELPGLFQFPLKPGEEEGVV